MSICICIVLMLFPLLARQGHLVLRWCARRPSGLLFPRSDDILPSLGSRIGHRRVRLRLLFFQFFSYLRSDGPIFCLVNENATFPYHGVAQCAFWHGAISNSSSSIHRRAVLDPHDIRTKKVSLSQLVSSNLSPSDHISSCTALLHHCPCPVVSPLRNPVAVLHGHMQEKRKNCELPACFLVHACPVSSSKDSGARRQTKLSPRTAGWLPHHFLRGRVVSLWRPSALASRLIPCFITIIISVPKASICTSMRDRCLKQTWGIPAVRSDPWSRLKESFTGSSNERGL